MKALFFSLILASALTLTACEKEGPAEKAGEKIDQAVESTKENLQEAKEGVADTLDKDGPAEEAGEKIDETAEEIKKKAQEAVK